MLFTHLAAESEEHRARREELRIAEDALIDQRESVAALRRALPTGPSVDDYEFIDVSGDADRPVALTELFSAPGRSLIVYHFMFGKLQADPCPMCTMWIDGFSSVAGHVTQNVYLVVAAAPSDGA